VSQIDPDVFHGQFDSVFDPQRIKRRDEYRGDYVSYLRGVAHGEQRQQPEKELNRCD